MEQTLLNRAWLWLRHCWQYGHVAATCGHTPGPCVWIDPHSQQQGPQDSIWQVLTHATNTHSDCFH